MIIWRTIWSFFDACVLRLFDGEVDGLVRQIAERLPDETADLT